MVSPSIDEAGQPFCYFSKPTGQIGMMYSESGTEITPEGYLRTGFGEMMFFAGPELEPTSVRIRTLEDGHLPVVHYSLLRAGIRYEFTMFTATLDGRPEGRQVNFVRVQLANESNEARRAVFATAIRYDAPRTVSGLHGENRFDRPWKSTFPGDYRQLGEKFDANWVYAFKGNTFLRDGRVLYLFPTPEERSFTLHTFYNYPPETDKPQKLQITEDTATGVVRYSSVLRPRQTRVLDFKMPVVPVNDASVLAAIDALSFDAARQQIRSFWQKILDDGMQIELPEKKPVDTFDASLIYALEAIDHIGPDYIQNTNQLNYHSFTLRDAADIAHMYDITGYPDVAGNVLAFFLKWQKPDGNFISQPQQYDGWGLTVWALAEHSLMTHDKAFTADVLPRIDHAVDWLAQARAGDPMHIIPASDVKDNENVPGHITGYNFLALAGLKSSIEMARDAGRPDLARKWQSEYNDYHKAFLAVLDRATQTTEGYIPPALDGQKGGYDWGNLLSVVPGETLSPHDPRVTATLKTTQAKYQEGIMTYADGEFLHHYLTIKNTLTEVVREDQQRALGEFYAWLLHTSAAHAGFEYAIRPWGDRNFADNLAPHDWGAAEFRSLMRDMLVREQDGDLHLMSVLSPEWIGAGKTIAVRQAPSLFGTVDFVLNQPSATSAILHLTAHFSAAPKRVVIHIPWFMTVKSATADGKSIRPVDGALLVPSDTHEIHIEWSKNPGTPPLSYAQTVRDYENEYARRYQRFMTQEGR